MILVKPRKRKSGNKVFSSLKAPQKHCTDLNIKTSSSSKRTTALRQPSGFQLASNVIYSTKKSPKKHCTKIIQRLLTYNLRVISRWFSSRSCFGSKWRLLNANRRRKSTTLIPSLVKIITEGTITTQFHWRKEERSLLVTRWEDLSNCNATTMHPRCRHLEKAMPRKPWGRG